MLQETLNTDSQIEIEKGLLKALLRKNPIGCLSTETKEILFKFRDKYSTISKTLPMF